MLAFIVSCENLFFNISPTAKIQKIFKSPTKNLQFFEKKSPILHPKIFNSSS